MRMKIITGNANPKLAMEIAEHCFATLVPAKISTFADGESSVEFLENIRGEDVFIVQSTCSPVNDSLMELMVMIDGSAIHFWLWGTWTIGLSRYSKSLN